MFERFTEGARRVVVYAQEECRLRDDSRIGTELLLLGLTHGADATSQALADAGFDTESGRHQLEAMTPAWRRENNGHIPFTPHAKQTLEGSLRVSNRFGHRHIAPPHVLLALLGVPDAGGIRLLLASGVDVDSLRTQAEALAQASATDTARSVGGDVISVVASGPIQGSMSAARRTLPGYLVEQQRDRLRAALVRYGRHDDGCDHDRVCTCGLARVLAEDARDEGSPG